MTVTAPLAWSESAMLPGALATVSADVAGRRRPLMVECGSGFSTLALARVLQGCGGSLVSLEHDALWATRVQDHLAAAGLAGTARVVLAPLALARHRLPWYAESALASLPTRIDVLLVDGPPAFALGLELSRYPALPLLADRLAPGATVTLDDIDRPGERQVLRAWRRECGASFRLRPAERIAVSRRPHASGR